MKTTAPGLPQGFSLVEVTLALGVAAFCLVALFGLLPIGINSNRTSLEQTAAASVAANVIADLRGTLVVTNTAAAGTTSTAPTPTPPFSKQFGIQVPSAANATTQPIYTLFLRDDGSMAQTLGATTTNANGWDINRGESPRYRVTLVFNPPAAGQVGVTPLRVLVTWPADADPLKATSLTDKNFPSRFSGSFEAMTALDRN